MKAGKSTLVLSALIVLASAGMAHASDADYRQVWRNSTGTIVRNTTGNCVRSMWILDHDPCDTPAPIPRHVVLEQEERTVYFAFDRADISPESIKRLDSLVEKLTPSDDIEKADIVGYADRIGTPSYNQALSKKRALAVRDYLASKGFIKPGSTKTRWVGETQPEAKCDDTLSHEALINCLQPDRKATVEIEFYGKTDATTDSSADAE